MIIFVVRELQFCIGVPSRPKESAVSQANRDARVHAGAEVDKAHGPWEPVAVAFKPVGVPVDFLDLDVEDVAHIGRTQPLGLSVNVIHPLEDAFVGD